MSGYTVELRKFIDWPSFNNVLASYAIFDEGHRATLNTLFIERYRFRDIGYETVEMFIQRLHAKLLEIMPLYNQLYETAQQSYAEFAPFVNVDVTSTGNGTVNATGTDTTTGTSTSTGHSESVSDQYDMPQTQLDQAGDYLTSRGVSTGDTTSSGTTNGTDTTESAQTSDSLGTTKGLSGASKAQLLMEYRTAILNIDAMIVDELGILFMQVWHPITRTH